MMDYSGTNEIFENSDNEEQLRKQKRTRDANVQTQDAEFGLASKKHAQEQLFQENKRYSPFAEMSGLNKSLKKSKMSKNNAKKSSGKRLSVISENAVSGATLVTMSSQCLVSYAYGRGGNKKKSYPTRPVEKAIVLQNNGKLLIYTQEDPFLKILNKSAADKKQQF